MKFLNIFPSVLFGATLTSLAFAAQPASAITLTPVSESFAFDPANGWLIDATAQGRAGGGTVTSTGVINGDYELGGFNDAIPGGSTFSQAQWVWGDNEQVSWLLNVDKTTGLASFTMSSLSNSSKKITINLGASDGFNGFGIVTGSQSADGKVNVGTIMSLTVNQINGQNINPFTTDATSLGLTTDIGYGFGKDLDRNYFALDTISYSLGGTLFMDWGENSINPQAGQAKSRVQFEVKIFDTPTKSTPEPGVTLGLLMMGALGIVSSRKNKGIKDEN